VTRNRSSGRGGCRRDVLLLDQRHGSRDARASSAIPATSGSRCSPTPTGAAPYFNLVRFFASRMKSRRVVETSRRPSPAGLGGNALATEDSSGVDRADHNTVERLPRHQGKCPGRRSAASSPPADCGSTAIFIDATTATTRMTGPHPDLQRVERRTVGAGATPTDVSAGTECALARRTDADIG